MQLDLGRFVVTYDASKLDEEDLIATIKEAGFEAQVVVDTDVKPTAVSEDEDVELPEFFVEALARAKREDKPLVLDFTAEWCQPCQRMLKETFPDPLVAPLLDRCIFLKIDTDKYPGIAKKYGVAALPDVRLLAPDGTEKRRLLDFRGPESFSEELKKLLGNSAEAQNQQAQDVSMLTALSEDAAALKTAFNEHAGNARLILLVSPG